MRTLASCSWYILASSSWEMGPKIMFLVCPTAIMFLVCTSILFLINLSSHSVLSTYILAPILFCVLCTILFYTPIVRSLQYYHLQDFFCKNAHNSYLVILVGSVTVFAMYILFFFESFLHTWVVKPTTRRIGIYEQSSISLSMKLFQLYNSTTYFVLNHDYLMK